VGTATHPSSSSSIAGVRHHRSTPRGSGVSSVTSTRHTLPWLDELHAFRQELKLVRDAARALGGAGTALAHEADAACDLLGGAMDARLVATRAAKWARHPELLPAAASLAQRTSDDRRSRWPSSRRTGRTGASRRCERRWRKSEYVRMAERVFPLHVKSNSRKPVPGACGRTQSRRFDG
jgi:hypothetical protein